MPLMTPLSAKVVHEGYGICQHVNFQSANNIHAGVTNQTAIMNRYGAMAVHQMRSSYPHTNATIINNALANCRNNDVKWNVVCATNASTQAEINARVNHIANNAADVVHWIEGVNEPNEGPISEWVPATVNRQRWIWEAVRSHPELDHVIVLGPSMHDVRLDNVNGQHWQDFVDGGGDQYMEMCAFHGYPGGSVPDNNRAQRVQWVYDAFGEDYPIKVTEWGYTNALGLPKSNRATGHAVIPHSLAAIYDVQAVLDFANAGLQLLRYEFMDDPDGGGNENNSFVQESNFGIVEVQTVGGNPATTWTSKASVAPLSTLLNWLKDPGSAYNPSQVNITISAPASVRTSLIQKRNGETRLYLWRHGQIWNPNTEQPITLGNVSVTVTDADGPHNLSVGPTVQYLEINAGEDPPDPETPTITLLTSGADTTPSATRLTSSILPTGDATLLAVATFDVLSTEIASVSGCGLTWTPIAGEVKTGNYAIRLYRGVGTPTTGPVTITYTGSTANSLWAVCTLSNASTVTASASNSVTGATSITATLGSAPASDSLSVGCFVVNNDSAITPSSGYTELIERTGTGPTMGLIVEHDIGVQSAGATWATQGGAAGFVISVGTGAAIPSGDAAGAWDFTGSAEGTPGASAFGNHHWTATASGTTPTEGEAEGSHEWVGTASGTTPGLPKSGDAEGAWLVQGEASGSMPESLRLYTPPTHEEGIRVASPTLRYYRLTHANSLVKINGVWTSIRTPSAELLEGLTNGVDYFRGGYLYSISGGLYAEISALFPSGPTPEDSPQLVALLNGLVAELTDDNGNFITA